MKDVIFRIIIIIAILGGIVYGSYRYGILDCRLDNANTQNQTTQNQIIESEQATQTVASADDCAVKRILCKTARDNCDTERVCNTSDHK